MSEDQQENDEDNTFRYIRQSTSRPTWPTQNPYPLHVTNLLSQLRDAERRRVSMTPGIPISQQRAQTNLRRYVSYPTFRSNNLRYSASHSNTAHSRRVNNDEAFDDEVPGSSTSQVEPRRGAAEQASSSSGTSGAEPRTNLKRPGSSIPDSQKRIKVDPGNIWGDGSASENLTANRHGSTSNIPSPTRPRGLPELLQLEPRDTMPYIIRSNTMHGQAMRRPLSEPSFLSSNPVELELQAIEAIQNFEDYVQDVVEVRGVDYLRTDQPLAVENLFLYTMRSIFPVFVLHPHLIIEFQTRAEEFDDSCFTSCLSHLIPERKVLPQETRDKCVICLAEFELQQSLRSLLCGHKFHVPCIDAWCKTAFTCPICRRAFADNAVDQRVPTTANALATLRGLEFVRAFLIRHRYGAHETYAESDNDASASQD